MSHARCVQVESVPRSDAHPSRWTVTVKATCLSGFIRESVRDLAA